MNENRGPWYLLTGLILGIALGLGYAWMIDPVEYVDMHPASLRGDFKDQYRIVIASAFTANADLARAQARLNLLEDPDPAQALAIQAQRALAEGHPEREIQALSLLAVAIEQGAVPFTPLPPPSPTSLPTSTPSPTIEVVPPTDLPTETPDPALQPGASEPTLTATRMSAGGTSTPGPTPTRTPVPTLAPLPSRTPTPTQGAPFVLDSMSAVCEPLNSTPLIMVEALDSSGSPLAGVEVIVAWAGGEDRFFTGFKPELGLGYADFGMLPGVQYSLHLAGGGEPVAGISTEECEAPTGERILASWRLVFVQP